MQKSKLILMTLLPLEKTLTLRNAIMLLKSLLNKDKNHYYYHTFFRKMFM